LAERPGGTLPRQRLGGKVKRLRTWIVVGVVAVLVATVAVVSVINWLVIGDAGIDLNGWIALFLGVFATLGLGIGLMSLVFISNRRGYDDP
jgi:hypothetical protein